MERIDLFYLVLSGLFINNFILIRFLGICPFIGVSRQTGPAFKMGLAVMFVMFISSFITWIIHFFVLVPFSLEFLNIVIFIFVIASLVQLIEIFIRAFSVKLYRALGVYLPLITTNCAILGLAFLNINEGYNLLESLVFALSSGGGFTLALLLMSAIREKLETGEVPKPFRGVPLAFITAAIMSLAFLGFGGFK